VNQHKKHPGSELESSRWDHEGLEPGGSGRPGHDEPASDASRTSPSVAPVAYQLEEECEEPPTTPQQRMPVFARNVTIAIVGTVAAFVVFGVVRSFSVEPAARVEVSAAAPAARVEASALEMEPSERAVEELLSESARMSVPPEEARRIVDRANARARMSLLLPERESEGNESLPKENASVLRSAEDSLVDAAAAAATLRCMDKSELNPILRVSVRFVPDGSVASVSFEGASGYPVKALTCIEDVFGELQIAGYREGERTFVRELGVVP
jgi:hypothetical protein